MFRAKKKHFDALITMQKLEFFFVVKCTANRTSFFWTQLSKTLHISIPHKQLMIFFCHIFFCKLHFLGWIFFVTFLVCNTIYLAAFLFCSTIFFGLQFFSSSLIFFLCHTTNFYHKNIFGIYSLSLFVSSYNFDVTKKNMAQLISSTEFFHVFFFSSK